MGAPTKYTWEQKKSILNRTLPPENITITALSLELGITKTTLYKWKERLNKEKPLANKPVKSWSSEDKFHVVLETYALNEADLSAYCRQKGLYPEQVKEWQASCLAANTKPSTVDPAKIEADLKEEKQRSKDLAKELARKEKALAETAALLVLRKKANAIWGDEAD